MSPSLLCFRANSMVSEKWFSCIEKHEACKHYTGQKKTIHQWVFWAWHICAIFDPHSFWSCKFWCLKKIAIPLSRDNYNVEMQNFSLKTFTLLLRYWNSYSRKCKVASIFCYVWYSFYWTIKYWYLSIWLIQCYNEKLSITKTYIMCCIQNINKMIWSL